MSESRLTIAIAVLMSSIFGLIVYWGSPVSYAWDFHQFYAAGQLPADEIYNLDAQYEMQEALWKEHRPWVEQFNFSPFLKPAYYWLALAPLATLSFWKAYWLFVGFQALSFTIAMVVLHKRFNLEPFLLFLLPMCPYVGLSLVWGQDTGFVFLCVVLALELCLRNREGLGGASLALGLIKWNQLMLFPALMLVQKRYRMFAGFAAAALIEISLSAWIPGRDGLTQYLGEYNNPAAHYWETSMQSVFGLLLDVGIPRAVGMTVLAALIGVFLYYARNLNIVQTFAAMGVAGPLLAIHTMGYDLMFALIPIVIYGPEFRTSYRGLAAVIYLSPLPYFADKMWHVGALRTMIFTLGSVVLWDVFRREADSESDQAQIFPDVARESA